MDAGVEPLLAAFDAGKTAALSRAVSIVENRRRGSEELMAALHNRLGRARRIGITGPPGSGKSTITTLIAREFRAADDRVGIVCVDPTSPFTGGALLGDRIRMEAVTLDSGVFIRSMATRGSLGGLAATSRDVADVLDAFGFERIIIETVGVGQSELDIARTTDTTVVVLVPEGGDSIQTLKAGVMEVADVFVVNKSDRPGADRLRKDVDLMLGLRKGNAFSNMPAHHGVDLKRVTNSRPREDPAEQGGWTPPVISVTATQGVGITELVEAVDGHFVHLERSGELAARRRERLLERVVDVVERRMRNRLWAHAPANSWLRDRLPDLESGSATPYSVADELLSEHGTVISQSGESA